MRSGSPPNYERPRRPSLVDAVEPEISKLLKNCPTMAASVIAERLDWPHGITILRDRVAELFHVPALQLERVMDESRTGHRLEDCQDLATIPEFGATFVRGTSFRNDLELPTLLGSDDARSWPSPLPRPPLS